MALTVAFLGPKIISFEKKKTLNKTHVKFFYLKFQKETVFLCNLNVFIIENYVLDCGSSYATVVWDNRKSSWTYSYFYCISFMSWKSVKCNGVRMVEFCKQNRRLFCSRCFRCYSCLKEKKKTTCCFKLNVVRLHWFFTIPHKAAAEWKPGVQHVLWLWWCQLFFPFSFWEWVGKKGCFLFFSSVVMKKFSSGYIRLSDLLLAPYITANRFFWTKYTFNSI